jgi:hypothetical protein
MMVREADGPRALGGNQANFTKYGPRQLFRLPDIRIAFHRMGEEEPDSSIPNMCFPFSGSGRGEEVWCLAIIALYSYVLSQH